MSATQLSRIAAWIEGVEKLSQQYGVSIDWCYGGVSVNDEGGASRSTGHVLRNDGDRIVLEDQQ